VISGTRAPEQTNGDGSWPRLPSNARLLEPGRFDVNSLIVPDCFGLLLLDGLITAQLETGRAQVAWLLGADDLIRPWEMDDLTLTRRPRWEALTRTTVLPVGGEVGERAARSPEILQKLLSRAARTTHWLLAESLILSAPSIGERLLLLFALYGERWGKVTPRGVRIDLPLTHQLLANLCGARRPTVSIALQSLSKEGFLARVSRDSWLLMRYAETDGRSRPREPWSTRSGSTAESDPAPKRPISRDAESAATAS
jgi:CRP-like cAMP-binding protein